MRKTSFSLRVDQIERLDELVEDDDRLQADSRSELLRELIDDYDDLRERVEDLERDLEHAQARADDLRRQLQEVQSQQDDVQELANYVERERNIQERKAQAGLVTRAKWAVFGMDVDDQDG